MAQLHLHVRLWSLRIDCERKDPNLCTHRVPADNNLECAERDGSDHEDGCDGVSPAGMSDCCHEHTSGPNGWRPRRVSRVNTPSTTALGAHLTSPWDLKWNESGRYGETFTSMVFENATPSVSLNDSDTEIRASLRRLGRSYQTSKLRVLLVLMAPNRFDVVPVTT